MHIDDDTQVNFGRHGSWTYKKLAYTPDLQCYCKRVLLQYLGNEPISTPLGDFAVYLQWLRSHDKWPVALSGAEETSDGPMPPTSSAPPWQPAPPPSSYTFNDHSTSSMSQSMSVDGPTFYCRDDDGRERECSVMMIATDDIREGEGTGDDWRGGERRRNRVSSFDECL